MKTDKTKSRKHSEQRENCCKSNLRVKMGRKVPSTVNQKLVNYEIKVPKLEHSGLLLNFK